MAYFDAKHRIARYIDRHVCPAYQEMYRKDCGSALMANKLKVNVEALNSYMRISGRAYRKATVEKALKDIKASMRRTRKSIHVLGQEDNW